MSRRSVDENDFAVAQCRDRKTSELPDGRTVPGVDLIPLTLTEPIDGTR